MASIENSFKRISQLIKSGYAPNDAADQKKDDEEDIGEKRKEKRYLGKNKTKRFVESFGT